MNKYKSIVALIIVMTSAFLHGSEVSALIKSQSSYSYLEHDWQKHDWQLDLEFNTSVLQGDLTVITRFMMDGEHHLNSPNNPKTYARRPDTRYERQHAVLELREFYWEVSGDVYWQIGKQQVVWGEADGLKLLDVINPQSYREFILDDFDDSRIPLWMVKAEMAIFEESELQLIWIPDTTTHDLAPKGSPFSLSSPLLVPVSSGLSSVNVESPASPRKPLKDSDAGVRLSTFWNGWDMTFNYLYHYIDEPVLRTRLSSGNVTVDSHYERSHLLGGSASSVIGDWTLRTEMAYETNRNYRSKDAFPGIVQADQFGSVVGLDYQGWRDHFLSIQWFQTTILGQRNTLKKATTEDMLSVLWNASFLNETFSLSVLNLYSLDHHDGLIRPKLTYNLLSNLDIVLGVDRFYGNSEGIFGQFDQADRVSIGFELGLD